MLDLHLKLNFLLLLNGSSEDPAQATHCFLLYFMCIDVKIFKISVKFGGTAAGLC